MAFILKNIFNERHEFVFRIEVIRAVHLPKSLIGAGTSVSVKRHKKEASTQVSIVDDLCTSNWNEALTFSMTMFKARRGKSWMEKCYSLRIQRVGSDESILKTTIDFSHFAALEISQTVCFSLPLTTASSSSTSAASSHENLLIISGMTLQENCFVSSPAMHSGDPAMLLKVTRMLKNVLVDSVAVGSLIDMDNPLQSAMYGCGHRQVQCELEDSNHTAPKEVVTRTLSPPPVPHPEHKKGDDHAPPSISSTAQMMIMNDEEEDDSQQKRILTKMASFNGEQLTHSFSSKRSDNSNTTKTSVKYNRPGNRLEDALFRKSAMSCE